MNTILISILLLLDVIKYIIFADIILSWLSVFGLNIRPKFITNIIEPMYKKIRNLIPTTFGAFDFTPIVILLLLVFIRGIIVSSYPGIDIYYNEIMPF